MKISVVIPHYLSKITAHAIYKLLENKGRHEVVIWVVDNNAGDGSIAYLRPFVNDIRYQSFPKNYVQSHGIAIDFVLPYVDTEYFITMESDSFPINDKWLDYYEDLIEKGYDAAGSYLQLSGGSYLHPCGAMYSKKAWQEAVSYCNNIEYGYFPNMAYKDGFESHVMLHKSIIEKVIANPFDYVELADEYKKLNRTGWLEKLRWYSPVVGPMHNGMGKNNESVKTYGQRTKETEPQDIILDNKKKIIYRVGEEPGQWLYYFMLAKGKKVFEIPTEMKWMPNREKEQQEYSLNEAGVKHIWAGSSYLGMKDTEMNDVYEFKKNQVNELYNSLPKKYKTDAN